MRKTHTIPFHYDKNKSSHWLNDNNQIKGYYLKLIMIVEYSPLPIGMEWEAKMRRLEWELARYADNKNNMSENKY